ncbi:unnamed protein product, partial [Rotaria sp. Silwood2]
SQRQHDLSEDDIIRSRLLYEGDQGIDDRRILTLMKTFNKFIYDLSSNSDEHNSTIEKLLSLLYSIEHSQHLLKSTYQMDELEQLCYASKTQRLNEQVKQLRHELDQSELRLIEAKQKRSHLLEYDARAATINKLGTRRELRAQQAATLERKHYFEHLQQTFEATYQQRLKQIAVYMRPIFELDEILRQDANEDSPGDTGPNESPVEQQSSSLISTLPTIKHERQRTNSDSSTASIEADDTNSTTTRSKRQHKNHLGLISLSASLANNQPQALFSNETELFGTQLINPLLLLSSSNIS